MSFGWDSSVIGGVVVMEPFKKDYGLEDAKPVETANLTGNIVSTLQAGCFVGALIASPLTDRYGRKWCLVGVAAVILVGVILQAVSSGRIAAIFVGRFIAGLGVGAASSINPLYVSENAPRAIRGLLTGLYQLFIVTGGMIAFWINYGSDLNFSGKLKYIFPLAIQGQVEEAKRILATLRNLPENHPYLEDEFQEIVDQIHHERQLMGDATFVKMQKEMWTVKGNRNRALISIFLMICQQMTGTNAINTYAPTIFKNLGIQGRSTGLFSTGIYGIVKVLACICFLLFMADSLGRRRSLLWTSIAQGCCMFYIGLYVRISPPIENQPVPGAGYMALVSIFLFAAFFQFGWGPACWIYASEIPTARLRSLNVALAAATQWLFNLIVARTVPNMLATVGAHGYGTYLIFGSFCFSMFFFVWFFVPETKGVSLEHMDALFGATEYDSDKKLAPDNVSETKSPVEVQVESANPAHAHVRKEGA
ncbi:MFS quinate transporter [Colletotrichum tofieldiae]|nr:MFS quinate transporter [Colletotrichum tofieldiae]